MRAPRLSFRYLLAAILAVLLAGCDESLLRPNTETPAAAQAEQWFRDGQFDRAGQAFMDLAAADRAQRDRYRLRAAEAWRESGNLDAAATSLEGIQARRLDAAEQSRLDVVEAEIALGHRDAARALALLTMPEEKLTPPLKLRVLELRARAQAANADALGSARTRLALDALLQGREREQNQKQIRDTLAQVDAEALKQQAAALPPNDALRPYLGEALRLRGQALPQTIANPNEAVGASGTSSNQPGAEGYRAAHVIALLVPVEGPLKAVAQPLRDGVFAAYFSDTHMPRPEVRVYDSGNDAAAAVAAYQRAVSEGADRVIGPLRRDGVSAVFAQGTLPVPVLALNQPEHNENPPPGSAAFALTPDSEAAQVAQHMLDRGITRAAVVVVASEWAERAAAAFRAQFEAGHGTVVGEARIRDADINYAAAIRQALATLPATNGAPANDSGAFISMTPKQARLFMPQLKLAGYGSLPVFATSHIYAGTLNAGLDHDLDGVEFCDVPWLFDAVVGLPKHSEIAGSLDSARGAGARLFAMGLDAYQLVPYLDWLAQHRDAYLPGATGQLTTDSVGRVQRVLTWARFQDGVAQPVSGSLSVSSVPAH
jgi:outer membrane PBP1 activator LpoA protein